MPSNKMMKAWAGKAGGIGAFELAANSVGQSELSAASVTLMPSMTLMPDSMRAFSCGTCDGRGMCRPGNAHGIRADGVARRFKLLKDFMN